MHKIFKPYNKGYCNSSTIPLHLSTLDSDQKAYGEDGQI